MEPFPHKYRVAGLPLDVEAWVFLDPKTNTWVSTLEGGEICADHFTKEEAEMAVRNEYCSVYRS